MFQPLRLKPIPVEYDGYVPPFFEPLIHAARNGQDLVPIIDAITQGLGFDTFTCTVSMSVRPNCESMLYVFTTVPAEWVAIYDQRSFIEVDPRVQTLLEVPLPMVWDRESLRGKSPKVDEFLEMGLPYGLGSGVAVGFYDPRGHAVFVAFNSKIPKLDAGRRASIFRNLGDILIFGHLFFEMFAASIVEEQHHPRSHGAPLSQRERTCLGMAARGLTSDDIARRLGITPRTVQFHFDSIRSKLGAATRHEAIAKAAQAGLLAPS
jgi:DNA-binding CsgD family transcriptional regulator